MATPAPPSIQDTSKAIEWLSKNVPRIAGWIKWIRSVGKKTETK